MINLEAGTYAKSATAYPKSGEKSYIIDANSFSIHTNNQFRPLSLLLTIAQTIDLPRNDATFSMIQGSGEGRQHKWLVYSILGSHGDYGTVMVNYTVG